MRRHTPRGLKEHIQVNREREEKNDILQGSVLAPFKEASLLSVIIRRRMSTDSA
jgi:hypothetical protein